MIKTPLGIKRAIFKDLRSQGFEIKNGIISPNGNSKKIYRTIQSTAKQEKLDLHKNFIKKNLKVINKYAIKGKEINPGKINLELRFVEPKSEESIIFTWWNLAWWSIPYERLIGRQMRFVLWDTYHDAPFGLIGLQSPPLRNKLRDDYLGIQNGKRDYWLNMSMYAQRVGALPPYNDLLGGKLVALSLLCNEIRNKYNEKYEGKKTVLMEREIPADLLFITTTSAFGKGTIYERIDFNGEKINEFLGYTTGSGTFHLSEQNYQLLINYLDSLGYETKRGYGTGPSRKLHLIDNAFRELGIAKFSNHGIKRGFYLFSNVSNLKKVITSNEKPVWYNRPFEDLTQYWKERWCIPRSDRIEKWKSFDQEKFIEEIMDSTNKFE